MDKLIRKIQKRKVVDWFGSFAFILPVVIGIAVFTITPMVSSLAYSFTRTYTTVGGMGKWVGFENYQMIFGVYWAQIGKSLGSTFLFTVISLPLNLVLSFALALFLSKDIKGIKVFRVIYYLPVMLPAVVSGILWSSLANGSDASAFNRILNFLHLQSYPFYDSENTAFFTFILMGLFTIGGNMILWIAQININGRLFEVRKIIHNLTFLAAQNLLFFRFHFLTPRNQEIFSHFSHFFPRLGQALPREIRKIVFIEKCLMSYGVYAISLLPLFIKIFPVFPIFPIF